MLLYISVGFPLGILQLRVILHPELRISASMPHISDDFGRTMTCLIFLLVTRHEIDDIKSMFLLVERCNQNACVVNISLCDEISIGENLETAADFFVQNLRKHR